ncbi:MAG: glycoside hydrolase family 3 N-terminal domain-containing protein [Gemmatimonadota bacterium]|nr:glycoside hydrolase family 3 N-terminal domain-containing protein [Gemmatimonadota bacterium]
MSGFPFPDPGDLSPSDLAGQLVCVALRDYAGDADERRAFLEAVERDGWGGVIVFGGDLAAVRDLLDEADRRASVPLLVTGDFERGFGQQFPSAGTAFPPLMALGAADDPVLARAVGRAVGREMRDAGFHADFWPVADLANEAANPIVATRAAGDDPRRVAAIVAAVVEGLQSAGVAACVKHVPGHGRTSLDSHETLPVVDADPEALEASDFAPFRAGIDAGARLAMTAHVAFPGLEPDAVRDRPATFSRAIATGLLRGAWGFDGLVCSDALMMGALAGLSAGESARRALAAGVDWLLYPPAPARVRAELAAAIEAGEVDRSRCEEAVGRLFALKRWAGVGEPTPEPSTTRPLPLAEAVAGAALTADPDDPPAGAAWPDRAQWVVVLDGAVGIDDVVLDEVLAPDAAERMIVVDCSGEAGEARQRLGEVTARCERAWVACAVFNPVRAWKGRAGLSAEARAVVDAACAPAAEAVLILFSNPRIVMEVDAPSRVVWCYGEDGPSQRAAVSFLRGELPATGRLPLKI